MMKTTLIGALIVATLPAVAFAAPSFQPAAAALVAAEASTQSATADAVRDADGLVLVREGGTRGRGRP
jgi:outer membrane lipoprotein-sorting protein